MAEVWYREFPEFAPTSLHVTFQNFQKSNEECNRFHWECSHSFHTKQELWPALQNIRSLDDLHMGILFCHGNTTLLREYSKNMASNMFNCLLNRSQIYLAKPRWRTCHQWYLAWLRGGLIGSVLDIQAIYPVADRDIVAPGITSQEMRRKARALR
jgi:hypothetical protein